MKEFIKVAAILVALQTQIAGAEEASVATLASERDTAGNFIGIKVVKLDENGPFSRLGLKAGDIVVSINKKAVSSQADFLKRLESAVSKSGALDLEVVRGEVRLQLHPESAKARP